MKRDDISEHLFHFIKGDTFDDASETLRKILKETRLLGGTGYIKEDYRCVCYSEAPVRHVGITLGDYAGIGPEIVRAALQSNCLPKSAEYVVIGNYPDCSLGEPTLETARAAAAALEEAVTLARRGELDAVVTGPIHKARMYEAGFKFPGQTEFFAERCGVKNFAMCLTGGKITVALVTTHIPLCKVHRALKQSEIRSE